MLEEGFLEHCKGKGVVREPLPSCVHLCQGQERLNDVGEVRNELVIEVAEAHEGVYCIDRPRGGPVVDGLKLDRVHRNLSFSNNQSKVFCLGCTKEAFLQFHAKLVLA